MLETYYRINEAVGLSIHIPPAGEATISACEIAVEANKLDFKKKIIDLPAAGDLKKHFAAKTCIALNLSGKGILYKQIAKVNTINSTNFAQILPNANIEDFYIQNFSSGSQSFISVIRRSEADKWLDLLAQQGFNVLTLSLGPFPVQNIAAQLNVYAGELVFDGHQIQRNEQSEWLSYQYQSAYTAPFPLKLESELIDEKLVIAYAAAFQLVLAANLNIIQTEVDALTTRFENQLAAKKLKVNAVLLLSVVFVLLLINFFLFAWLNSANGQLTGRLSLAAQSTTDSQAITEQVQTKEALLKTLGWDGGVNKSALIDQLAALLPPELAWREISINPVEQPTGQVQKLLQFRDGQIKVTGSADRIIPVNEWLARVKTKKWVKNIQLESYTYNSELNTGQFIVIVAYAK